MAQKHDPVTLSFGIVNVILASCDVEKDPSIVDHLFADVFDNKIIFIYVGFVHDRCTGAAVH